MDGPEQWQVDFGKTELRKRMRILEYMAHFRVGLRSCTTTLKQGARRRGRHIVAPRARTGQVHVLVKRGGRWQCQACPRWAATLAGRKRLQEQRCAGRVAALTSARARAGVRRAAVDLGCTPAETPEAMPHATKVCGAYAVCLRCAAYALRRARGLLRACSGPLSCSPRDIQRAYRRDRLLDGRHPVTGAALESSD